MQNTVALTFIKAQISSITATIVDFSITLICAEVFGIWHMAAIIMGTVAGGMVNFYMGRNWAFNSRSKKVTEQALKYILVWAGNLLIVFSLSYILVNYLNVYYIYSKILISVLVGTTYNYFLQKRFIFNH